jgi:hypothetical protein
MKKPFAPAAAQSRRYTPEMDALTLAQQIIEVVERSGLPPLRTYHALKIAESIVADAEATEILARPTAPDLRRERPVA